MFKDAVYSVDPLAQYFNRVATLPQAPIASLKNLNREVPEQQEHLPDSTSILQQAVTEWRVTQTRVTQTNVLSHCLIGELALLDLGDSQVRNSPP